MSPLQHDDPRDLLARAIAGKENPLDRLARLEAGADASRVSGASVNALAEVSTDLGEMSAGTDSEGPELITNGDFSAGDNTGWTGSTGTWTWTGGFARSTGAAALASTRFGVSAGGLLRAAIDAGQGGLPVVRFYDDPTAGNLVSEAALIVSSGEDVTIGSGPGSGNGERYQRTLRVPYGAVSAVLAGSEGIYDNATVREITTANRFGIEPFPQLRVDGVDMRIAAGVWRLPSPPVPVITGTFDANASRYWYILTVVDADGGETTPGEAGTNRITGTRTLSLPVPAGLHTRTRIYRCIRANVQIDRPPYSDYVLIGEVAAGVGTFADNGLSAIGGAPPTENTTTLRPALPVTTRQMVNSMRSKNGLQWVTTSSQVHGEYWRTTDDALGDWIAPDPVYLDAGHYRMSFACARATLGGIMAVYVDGRSIGSVNFYAGTTGFNYIATIDFLIDEPGLHEIVWVVVSTSGSGYRVFVTEYWINRIGR